MGDAADKLILQTVDLPQGLDLTGALPKTAISRTWAISLRDASRTMAKSEA